MDMQEGFRNRPVKEVLPSIKKYIQSFDGRAVYACFLNEKKSLFETELDWKVFQPQADREILRELKDLDLPKFWHSGYTILTSEMQEYIRKEGFTEIYLAGIFTDVCIAKTAMDVFDFGLVPKVVENCVATLHGQDVHAAVIKSLKYSIGWHNIV